MFQLLALLVTGIIGIMAFLLVAAIVIVIFQVLFKVFLFTAHGLCVLVILAIIIGLLVTFVPPVFNCLYAIAQSIFYFVYGLFAPVMV